MFGNDLYHQNSVFNRKKRQIMNKINIGILTISDRASQGIYQDISGEEIRRFFKENIKSEWQECYYLINDNYENIKKTLMKISDKDNCSLIITTGGTGPAARDLTPDATIAVCSRLLPGFGELMRIENAKKVPTAILSRQVAGIRGKTLIINLPGNPKAINECLSIVFPAIPDCLKLIGAPEIKPRDENIKSLH